MRSDDLNFALSVSSLTPAVGGEVTGVDCIEMGDAESVQERNWHRNEGLLFRGQQLTDDDLLTSAGGL
jgi:hypothetical protein